MSGIWIRRSTKNTNGIEYISGETKKWDGRTNTLTTVLTIYSLSKHDVGFYNYSLNDIKSADIELNAIKCKFYSRRIVFVNE